MSNGDIGKPVDAETARRINEERDRFVDRIRDNVNVGSAVASSLDKTLVSLSGGALIFSMTFIDRIGSTKLWLWVLVLSWAAFVGCICCVIFANREQLLALTKRAEELGKQIDHFEEEVRCGRLRSAVPGIITNKRVGLWNEAAVWAFLLGIALLGTFVIRNV
jgi:hypothetical protein